MIAVVVVVYSPQPTRWMSVDEHAPSVVHLYRSVASERVLAFEASDSERVEANLASGFGYNSLEIRRYDTSGIAELEPRNPLPVKRRAFLTELGWPNLAFATNSHSIGLRFGYRLDPNAPSDDAARHDPQQTTLRILWAGFCLNSLLIATLFLLPFVLSRRLTKYFHLSRPILAAVCLGLWFALLSAWGFDLVHHVVPFLPRNFDVYEDPIVFHASVRSIDLPSSAEWVGFRGYVNSSIGYRETTARFWKLLPNNRASSIAGGSLLSLGLGWPTPCLKGLTIGPWEAGGDPWPKETKLRHVVALMAMPVWWPGMLINWLFYAVVILVVLRGPGALRRFNRRRRHRCLMCGYPLGEASRCSECGQLHRE